MGRYEPSAVHGAPSPWDKLVRSLSEHCIKSLDPANEYSVSWGVFRPGAPPYPYR